MFSRLCELPPGGLVVPVLKKSSEPVKWQKYLTLVDFGFLTYSELLNEVHRYDQSDSRRLITHLHRDISRERAFGRAHLYVIKLVPVRLQGQLPNFQVKGIRGVAGLASFLARNKDHPYSEIWYCRTQVDDTVFSVAGRWLFALGQPTRSQVLEQVWRCSPRMLESFNERSAWGYARASRPTWGWRYSLEDVHSPHPNKQQQETIVEEFAESLRILENARHKIEPFVRFLESFGFTAFSLEYKIVRGKLSIIDWDTPDDIKVLETQPVGLLPTS